MMMATAQNLRAQHLSPENRQTDRITIHNAVETDRLVLKPTARPDRFEIRDQKAGALLGTVTQPVKSAHPVELFWGKGGFMGTVLSPLGVRYFALPGSSVRVGKTELELEGDVLCTTSIKRGIVPKPLDYPHICPQGCTDQAMILGAGLATRFERISGDSTGYSKPAVPFAGRASVIECIAHSLAAHGFSRLTVNTCFKPESLKHSLARCQDVEVRYIDEAKPSGTAGGLRKMLPGGPYRHLLDDSKPLLVVQGDSVTDADFSALMANHEAHRALVTIGCRTVADQDVDKFGIIVTDRSDEDGQSGHIRHFQEKPRLEEAKSRLGNTGFYIFSPQAFPIIRELYEALLSRARRQARQTGQPEPVEVPLDFAMDVFPALLERTQADPSLGAFRAQTVDGYWSDIGNPRQYLESVHDFYAGKVRLPFPEEPDRYYRDGVVFWEGAADIADREGARLSGNVIVALPFQG
jgi:mannose-1-phosphate guanylyltransferase